MTFGDKLINLRKQNKMTQDEIGEKLGVTRQTVSNWELNQTKPDLEQLKGISKFYKVSLDELIDNNIKELLTEKISNTEKLAGLIYKILKVMLVIFLGGIVLIIISVTLFTVNRAEVALVSTMDLKYCNLNDKYYDIRVESKNEQPVGVTGLDDLEGKININQNQSVTKILNNIVDYFETNGGSCE